MPIGLGIGLGMQFSGGSTDVDPIAALSPTIYLKAEDGYFVDGACRFGDIPGVGATNNWMTSSAAGLASGSAGWSATCLFCIDGENAVTGDQTIASKGAAAKFEWVLALIRQSATTFIPRLTCYTANGVSSITATSTVTCTVGTTYQVSWGYENSDGQCHISVNNETLVESASTLTIGTNDGAFRIGSWFNATQNLNGRIDSFGISIGDQYCVSQRVQLYNSGAFKRYEDITGIKTLTAWWDFGNSVLYDHVDADPNNHYGKWDWQMDSVGEGATATYTLTQASATANYPYVVRGLIAPNMTADTDVTALGYYDSSGNDNLAIQPWFFSRPGYKTVTGRPWFWFPGGDPLLGDIDNPGNNAYRGYWMPCFLKTADQTTMGGINKSFSFCCEIIVPDILVGSSFAPLYGAPLFAWSVAGICRLGMMPWRAIDVVESEESAELGVRFLCANKVYQYTPAHQTRWRIEHYDNAGLQHNSHDTYAGRMDSNRHALHFTFDGTTAIIYIDGNAVLSADITQDTATLAGPLGTKTIKVFGVGDFGFRDNMFNRGYPPIEYGSAGRPFYGYMDRMAFFAGVAHTPAEVTTVADDILDSTSHPLTGALALPTTTTGLTLLHWLDAAYGQKYVGRDVNSNVLAYSMADADKVGMWRSRKGTVNFTASTDAKRPALKLSIQNGLPVVRFDGNTNKQLLNYAAALAQPITIFIVGRRESGSSEGYYWGGDSGNRYFGHANTSAVSLYAGGAGGISGTATSQTTMSLWKVFLSGASSSIIRDGVSVATGNPGTTGITTTMHLGGIQDSGSVYFLPCDLAEVRIYTGTASGTELADITAELKSKWSTP